MRGRAGSAEITLFIMEVIMRSPNEIWEVLGEIDEEETRHVLTRLFSIYEQSLTRDGESKETQRFFQNLNNAIDLSRECNLNRR